MAEQAFVGIQRVGMCCTRAVCASSLPAFSRVLPHSLVHLADRLFPWHQALRSALLSIPVTSDNANGCPCSPNCNAVAPNVRPGAAERRQCPGVQARHHPGGYHLPGVLACQHGAAPAVRSIRPRHHPHLPAARAGQVSAKAPSRLVRGPLRCPGAPHVLRCTPCRCRPARLCLISTTACCSPIFP